MKKKILIVDDEKSIRETLKEILEFESYDVETAIDGQDGFEKIQKKLYDLILCDIKMPRMNGIELLEKVVLGDRTQFIMISAHATIDIAVQATKQGAFNFIEKPPDLNHLLTMVRNALDKSSLVIQNKSLKRKIPRIQEIIGESSKVTNLRNTIDKVGESDARVLIMGENGSGKELVAKWLHEKSPRRDFPFIEVNCAAIPSELIESELFGHEKGAFTSAIKQRIGKFEQAHQGTIFLDEIGDMSLSAQAKVLRVLQENKITRVGGGKQIPIDVRVLAATNKNLKTEIKDKNFREDLFHRLSVIILEVPPLRDRKEDISLLSDFILKKIAQRKEQPPKSLSKEGLQELCNHAWTGNIRELQNVIERLTILCEKDTICKECVQKHIVL